MQNIRLSAPVSTPPSFPASPSIICAVCNLSSPSSFVVSSIMFHVPYLMASPKNGAVLLMAFPSCCCPDTQRNFYVQTPTRKNRLITRCLVCAGHEKRNGLMVWRGVLCSGAYSQARIRSRIYPTRSCIAFVPFIHELKMVVSQLQ